MSDTPPEGDTVTLDSENWMDFVPEELREDPSITKFNDFGSLVKGYHSAVGMIGKDKIVMPETDEQFADVYSRLGRPDEATGYELKTPDGIEDSQKFDEEFDTTLKTLMHGLGLSGKQAQGMNDFLYGTVVASGKANTAASEAASAESMTALRGMYGANVDAHVEASMRVIRELGGDMADNAIEKEDLMQNPILVKIFSGIAEKVLEDTGLQGGDQGSTQADIQADIEEIQAHPGFLDKKHVEHKSLVERAFALRQRLHSAAA